jgi:dTDP-4-dehydrorhamnose 3,5-epimerase-like enzyme
MSEIFVPDSYRGFSFCDPQFKFTWPDAPEVMSEKDKLLPNLDINRLLIEFSK